MFTSKIDHLANFCSYEAGYMVVWSKPELIRESLKQQQEENAERAKKAPLFVDAQNIIMEYDRLETAHSAICSTIEKAFKKAEINIAKLNVRKALKEKVDNLYYVGANTNPGIGMPTCLISAQTAYKRIEKIKNPSPLTEL